MPRRHHRPPPRYMAEPQLVVPALYESPTGRGYKPDRERRHFLSPRLDIWPGKFDYLNYLAAALEILEPPAQTQPDALLDNIQDPEARQVAENIPLAIRTRLKFQIKPRRTRDNEHGVDFYIGYNRYAHFKDNRHHLNWEEHLQKSPAHRALRAKSRELEAALGLNEGDFFYHEDMDALLLMMQQTPKFAHMVGGALHKGPHLTQVPGGQRHPQYAGLLANIRSLETGEGVIGENSRARVTDFVSRYSSWFRRDGAPPPRDTSTDGVFFDMLITHIVNTHRLRRPLLMPLTDGGDDLHEDDSRVGGRSEGRFNYFLRRYEKASSRDALEVRLAADAITRRDLARDMLPVAVGYTPEQAARVEYVIDQANQGYMAHKAAFYEHAIAHQLAILMDIRTLAYEGRLTRRNLDTVIDRHAGRRPPRDARHIAPPQITIPEVIPEVAPISAQAPAVPLDGLAQIYPLMPETPCPERSARRRFRDEHRSPSARRRYDEENNAG